VLRVERRPLSPGPRDDRLRRRDVILQTENVLPGRRERRLLLFDLVLIGGPIELEQRLCPFFTAVFALTSTAVTSVGSGNRGTSWIVCWMTLASVEYGVMKCMPIRNTRTTCIPVSAQSRPR
jgi:hypothetical protein